MSSSDATTGPLPSFARFALVRPGDPVAVSPFARQELDALGPRASARRRSTFLLGRAAAHLALAALGRDDGPVLIGPKRAPTWPSGVVGSIAHTDRCAVALVAEAADAAGIGVDVEASQDVADLFDHVPRVEERAWIDALSADERQRAVLALFSAKETVFKALFPTVGVLFDFDAVSLRPVAGGFVGRIVGDLHPQFVDGHELAVTSVWDGDQVVTWTILAPIGDGRSTVSDAPGGPPATRPPRPSPRSARPDASR